MPLARQFEDLDIWKGARRQVRDVYRALDGCRDFSFRDQIRSAAISVMNNIAEGFERRTRKDFAHFLDTAKGSNGEVRSMLYSAEDVALLDPNLSETLRDNARHLSERIAALTRRVRQPLAGVAEGPAPYGGMSSDLDTDLPDFLFEDPSS